METRHPVKTYFGREFAAICYHCRVMVAWSRQKLKILKKFLRFLEKRLLMIKFSKLCSKSLHRDTDRRCCVHENSSKIVWRWNRWNRALFTWPKKNFGTLSNCRYCADRAQSLPWPAPDIWLTTFQISFKSVHFRRSYSRPHEGRSLGPLGKSNTRPSRPKRYIVFGE